MNDQQKQAALDKLNDASPLEAPAIMKELELYDKTSSQSIIDEVYKEFETGEDLERNVLEPVFLAVIDGMLEATSAGKSARKKGLTASRVIEECKSFSYDGIQSNATTVNGYAEYKNARDNDSTNPNMSQEYVRDNYQDTKAMEAYKNDRVHGEKTLKDEYTGKDNLYLKQDNPNRHYNDETHRKQAQPDHIVPLKQLHERYKSNYAMDDSDIKRFANMDDNFAVTSAEINQVKKEMTNAQYIAYMEAQGTPVDPETAANMIQMQKSAERAMDREANRTVARNLLGEGEVDKKRFNAEVEKYKQDHGGESPTKEQKKEITDRLQREKTSEIRKEAISNANQQAIDYAAGNVILFIVKPLYYEMSDIFRNGMVEGVGAASTKEAFGIRFGRVKKHIITHGRAFLGDNIWSFVKGFISSLLEGIISLFFGIFKQLFKLLKEGVKVFTQAVKVLFGEESKNMTAAQKGDAIIKILGGSVIAIAGIGIEALINQIGIGEPWSVVLATMLSGIASALFMYLLNKADLFSNRAALRNERINDIFDERIREIQEAEDTHNIVFIDFLKQQRKSFEENRSAIQSGLDHNNIDEINVGLYKMASYMGVDLPYGNTDEFIKVMDSKEPVAL